MKTQESTRRKLDDGGQFNAAIRAGAVQASDDVVEAKLKSDYFDHEIKPSEAAPAFGGMLCCLVLVPFGVLAPLFFWSMAPNCCCSINQD